MAKSTTNHGRWWLAGVFAVALLQSGCGFSTTLVTKEAQRPAGKIAQAKEQMPLRAVLDPSGGVMVSRTLKGRFDRSQLFREVFDLSVGGRGDRSLRKDDALIAIRPTEVVDYDRGFPTRAVCTVVALHTPVVGYATLLVFGPWDLVYHDQVGLDLGYELTLSSLDGRVLYRDRTVLHVAVTAQAFAFDLDILHQAQETAADAAERILIERLTKDASAHEAILAGLTRGG